MNHEITVRARFETGHRLPHLPGKCVNLHGHSWNAHVTVAAPTLGEDAMVVDFSTLKQTITDFTDARLDHGMMLGAQDPYADRFRQDGIKVFIFGEEEHTHDLAWPTVEAVATMLARFTTHALTTDPALSGATLVTVQVTETENNIASYMADLP